MPQTCPRNATDMPQMMPQTCPRHASDDASDDARDMSQMMAQTCPRHMTPISPPMSPRYHPRCHPHITPDVTPISPPMVMMKMLIWESPGCIAVQSGRWTRATDEKKTLLRLAHGRKYASLVSGDPIPEKANPPSGIWGKILFLLYDSVPFFTLLLHFFYAFWDPFCDTFCDTFWDPFLGHFLHFLGHYFWDPDVNC